MADVVHLGRIRAAIRLLLSRLDDPTAAGDASYMRQVNTAVETLLDHGNALPRRHQGLLRRLLDPTHAPEARHQALLDLARRLHLDDSPVHGDDPATICTLRPGFTQGRLFAPPDRDEPE